MSASGTQVRAELSSIARRLETIKQAYGEDLSRIDFDLAERDEEESWLRKKLPSRASTKKKKRQAEEDLKVLKRELREINASAVNIRRELVGDDSFIGRDSLVDTIDEYEKSWEENRYGSCLKLAETIVEQARRQYDVDPLGDYNIVYKE